jgi:hypothetical protein
MFEGYQSLSPEGIRSEDSGRVTVQMKTGRGVGKVSFPLAPNGKISGLEVQLGD